MNTYMLREIKTRRPKLTITIVESKDIVHTQPIVISPSGYAQSKRTAKDGIVFFGTLVDGNISSNNFIKIDKVDYLVPIRDYGFGEKHFCIYWDPEEGSKGAYKLQDLFQGTGTFALLTMPLEINLDQVVSFG